MNYYNYRKVQNFPPDSTDTANRKMLYTFKSPKSKQWYWIWVEEYYYNMYTVKFHLKADRNSKLKYNRLTGLNEARTVLNTCIVIMLEIYQSNCRSSFGFIASPLISEDERETKRFRIYKKIMATYFSHENFEHVEVREKSTYMMICRTELKKDPCLISKIEEFFSDNYEYFN